MKILLGLQLQCTVGAAGDVLLEFMAGIIRQLAINLKDDIFSNPFTLHNCLLSFELRAMSCERPETSKLVARSSQLPHIRQRPAQLLRGPEEGVFGGLFRGMQNLSNGSQLQPVIML